MNNAPAATPGAIFIALSGKKQVGKDTSAQIIAGLLTKQGKRVTFTAFAEALKEMCIGVLGLPRNLVYGTDADKNTLTHIKWDTLPHAIRMKYSTSYVPHPNGSGLLDMVPRSGPMTVREVLQIMGTDIFRDMFEGNVWANSPFRRNWSEYNVVIITDCRFPNEKSVTETRGGTVIRIERNTGLNDTHASETSLDNAQFDHRYVNNGSLAELETFLTQTLTKLNLL
jgi:hypothetical protein